MNRKITYYKAINEAIDLCLSKDTKVFTIGLGVPDPKGVFGTTVGLIDKYGPERVMDMPTSENALTGFAIGAAISGMRPIMSHQRVDFALPAMEQIVNQAANWQYMFGGLMSVPLVIRMVIGRGWGQGPQHSQSLQAWFAHVPGLKVVMPTTPYDAKGLLVASVDDDNPVIFIEHRWLHNVEGHVPKKTYHVPIGLSHKIRIGNNITIISASYMVLESLRAAEILHQYEIEAEVIDLRTISPLDKNMILESVMTTRHLLVVDNGWKSFGVGAEIISLVVENAFQYLEKPPQRLAFPDLPTPTTPALANVYYPRAIDIAHSAMNILNTNINLKEIKHEDPKHLDIPDPSFTGPF